MLRVYAELVAAGGPAGQRYPGIAAHLRVRAEWRGLRGDAGRGARRGGLTRRVLPAAASKEHVIFR